ncbi:MAG: nucleoside deaminase, partial [Saccharofermentans sp.]|nr:nucleoside deaminase [Saccharofermentans sp.]
MDYMNEAIKEARSGILSGHGGPFGSVVVDKEGKIIGKGHNKVLASKDPTCHGEMEAIRDACKNLGTHDLTGCSIYTTAEPCPMCLGAILWSNMDKVFYGCNIKDTDEIGFRDDKFYNYFKGDTSILEIKETDRKACLELFDEYK